MPQKDNLNKVHSLRVSDTLWNHILSSSKKYGITPSVYIRKLLQADKESSSSASITQEEYMLYKEKIRAINHLTYEINSIGVNINQIAKNTNSHFYSNEEKAQLMKFQQNLIILVQNYLERLQ